MKLGILIMKFDYFEILKFGNLNKLRVGDGLRIINRIIKQQKT